MGDKKYTQVPEDSLAAMALNDSPLSEDAPYLPASDGLLARKSGEWAKRKHHYLRNYCGITTKAMQRKWRLVYLDVMAGPGRCKIKETGEEFPDSPLVALDHPFDNYIFIEESPDLANALQQRVSNHPKASQIEILRENWIETAATGRLRFDANTLVVAFVDPTGISQIPLPGMLALAKNPRIDLLVTIQHSIFSAPPTGETGDGTSLRNSRAWPLTLSAPESSRKDSSGRDTSPSQKGSHFIVSRFSADIHVQRIFGRKFSKSMNEGSVS